MSNLVDPQHSLQSRHGVDGTLGSPGEIKNIRSKIMGSPGVWKDVCVSNNRSMIWYWGENLPKVISLSRMLIQIKKGHTFFLHFWLFLAPPADPVEFLWFKREGTGVPHIVLHVSCWTRTFRGYFRPQKSVLSKIAIFSCFWAKIGGVISAGTVGQNDFFYKIKWLLKTILALEPKFHEDWSKNGHATRRKS